MIKAADKFQGKTCPGNLQARPEAPLEFRFVSSGSGRHTEHKSALEKKIKKMLQAALCMGSGKATKSGQGN